ncbi:hypothetical protein ABEB36_003440 [Hypothenemus hampei]|uniref:C2H2-type domain-containing protein n=1 Tax=Hypothenemus hampei TaxID=57062 RepID=A0ABD1FB02_HYPHA
METHSEGAKAKTLAVFENVVTKEKRKRKFRTNRFSDDDSSLSDSDLIINENHIETSKKKRVDVRIPFKQEKINIKCQWEDCMEVFSNYEQLLKHLKSHVDNLLDLDLDCKWQNCPSPTNIHSQDMLLRHLTYHGYIAKLVNIGENVLNRNDFPECSLEQNFSIDIPLYGYVCKWENCDNITFNTIGDFLGHIECHVLAAPSGKQVNSRAIIQCHWNDCNNTFSTRYKLEDHLRVHTKERVIACPKCMALFSSKTTFSDHRKRQLKTDMRSYQCSQCLKLFSVERLLKDHMRSHINQYKCTLCDMTSPKPSMLAKHYKYRHMNIRYFTCQICSKTFVSLSNLNTHLLTHQDKPFKCEQCEFGCKSKVGLKSHMVKVHGLEAISYECQVCKSRFKRGDYLTYHLIKFHKFHWPSGHCRFRYRKDSDGVHRLQMVRYESLEVTEEMIKSESMQSKSNPNDVPYSIITENTNGVYTMIIKSDEQGDIDIGPTVIPNPDDFIRNQDIQKIIITIEDVDEQGNVLQTREVDANELCLYSENENVVKKVCRDMPDFDTCFSIE